MCIDNHELGNLVGCKAQRGCELKSGLRSADEQAKHSASNPNELHPRHPAGRISYRIAGYDSRVRRALRLAPRACAILIAVCQGGRLRVTGGEFESLIKY